MRILYLSQYFPPEAGATQARAYEMCHALVQAGHAVTVITEFPNHPSGVMRPGYNGKLYEQDELDGIEVLRVWVKASPTKSFGGRIGFYLSYMVNAILAGIFLARGHYDLILATSPPLFTAAAGLALSTVRCLPLVGEVRDLWPAAAIALGELRNPRFIRWATRLEESYYHRSQKIIVVTRGMQQALETRGIEPGKLVWIPNGANTDLFQYRSSDRLQLRQGWGLENHFIAVYAGILGIAQGLETVLQAAQLLLDHPSIHIILVGDGPQRARLIALQAEWKLTNLTILPEQPQNLIPGYLSAADVALVPLRKLDVFQTAVPSKLFDAWACQRPVICGIQGEAQEIVTQAQGGINISPEDPQALAQALIDLQADPDEAKAMGKRGRHFTSQHYSRQALAQRLIRVLQEVIEKESI